MKRKTSSTFMKMQRVTGPQQAVPVAPPDPATEIALIVGELSAHGRTALLTHARTIRDEERRRGSRAPLISLSLRDFVARVQEAANDAITGLYGNKVFIAALYRMFEERGEASGCKMAEFKDRLLMAQRAGSLTLERCESLDRVEPTLVVMSEVRHMGSIYHFVVRKARESGA